MKYSVEKFKWCNKCRTPMDKIKGMFVCPKCGHTIRIKAVIGNRLI